MASGFLPDEVVLNILAKLSAKPLLRFRCVSKYWHCMLMEPSFMKLRSRKTVILPILETLHFVDTNSIFTRCYPLEHPPHVKVRSCAILTGSFNGLVLMIYLKAFILYNPFTGEYKKLPPPPCRIRYKGGTGGSGHDSGYGFGYGATSNDLKIVRFIMRTDICEVYDFKTNSWSSWSTKKYDIDYIKFQYPVGTFLNGYLYWVKSKNVVTVLSVKDMALSEIILPITNIDRRLGTINGCLCALKMINSYKFELWVRKEHDSIDQSNSSWLNTHSFTLDFDYTSPGYSVYRTLNILDDGRILMVNPFKQVIIYDISKSSYETLPITFRENHHYFHIHCVEYVETLVSPLDLCISRLDGRKRKKSDNIKE